MRQLSILSCCSFRFSGGNLLVTCVISLLRIALKPSLVLKASAHVQVMALDKLKSFHSETVHVA